MIPFLHLGGALQPHSNLFHSFLNAFSATNKMEDKDNQGDHEQHMDQPAGDMKSKSTAPE